MMRSMPVNVTYAIYGHFATGANLQLQALHVTVILGFPQSTYTALSLLRAQRTWIVITSLVDYPIHCLIIEIVGRINNQEM